MEMIFIELRSEDGSQVEATARRYHEGVKLPPGQWNLKRTGEDGEVTDQTAFEPHWKDQLIRWNQWAERNVDLV